eukprot:gene63-12883_t
MWEWAATLPILKVTSSHSVVLTPAAQSPRAASVGGGHSCPLSPPVSASTLTGMLPSVGPGIVRSYLRCCMPSALSRACLSRGVQHSSAVVQVTALQVLQHMLDGMAPVVTAIQAAQQRWEAASSDDISEGTLCTSSLMF